MAEWSGGPAFGSLLARIAALYARALRVDIERRRQAHQRMVKLLTPGTDK